MAPTEGDLRGATHGLAGTLHGTPLVSLSGVSALIPGARIVAKAEHLSPGGSVKDRPALSIILDAERRGILQPGGHIVEATGGNTGISLALLGLARGYKCHIVMNNTIAAEKLQLMELFGAEVILVDPAPFSSDAHYFKVGQRLAESNGWFFSNQFENPANYSSHETTTGPEIWAQSGGVDAFTCAAGTGGTLAGVSRALHSKSGGRAKSFLAEIPGGVLRSYLLEGTLDPLEGSAAGMEGIGIDRVTLNFRHAKLSGVLTVDAPDAIRMAYYILRTEGIWVGMSAAVNVLAACRVARHLVSNGARKGNPAVPVTVATILCDAGERGKSKIWDREWVAREFGKDFEVNVTDDQMRRIVGNGDVREFGKVWSEEGVSKL